MEEEEVVLGLIPAPDWVENRPLEEGGEIELAAAKKLQSCKEAEQNMEIKLKKETDADIEEITLDSEEEESQEVKIKQEEAFHIETATLFQDGTEGEEIETTEEKHHIAVPIVFSAGKEDGEMKMKKEEELQIEASPPEFLEEEEVSEEVNMHEEEEPHIEAVTVFSDSDEGETIQIKEEEEVQIEAVTVYSDTESGEDSESGQENKRYNVQNNRGSPITYSLAPPQATVIETAVQDVYGCNSCSQSFSCTGELSKHVRSHPPRRKPFVCRVCLKTDSLAANLKRHMRTHSGEKPYSCVLCFKMFTSAYSLKIHMRIHSGYKPYACRKCPRAFYQKTDLNKHSMIHFRTEQMLQSTSNLPESKDSNSVNQNVKVRIPSTTKILSRGVNSGVPNVFPRVNQLVLSSQSANRNSRTDDSRTVNSQAESPSNVRHDSPVPFTPVITEVVGSFHEEDSEMQLCPSPSSDGGLQKRVSLHPTSLGGNQIRVGKAVNTQPVINSVNPQGVSNTVALQDTVVTASSPGGKQFVVKKNVYEQPEVYSVSSQNGANSGTTLLSPAQLPTNVVPPNVAQNSANSAATVPNTPFVNNEMFCIPLIINGQMCYAIPAQTPSQLSVVNNPAPIQTEFQPVNSHNVPSQDAFLLPVFVPPISNGVLNPNSLQPTTTPTVIPQTLVLGNATPNQSQHQIRFQSAPVNTVTSVRPEISPGSQMTTVESVTRVQPENSLGSQITTVKTVPCVQPENSAGSQITTVETVPHCRSESSLGSQVTTVKTAPHVKLENSLGSQMTTVKSVSKRRPNKQFLLPPPPKADVEAIQKAHYHEYHHNHDLTITKRGSNGFGQHERVYCNLCKAAVTVFTKRDKHKKVS